MLCDGGFGTGVGSGARAMAVCAGITEAAGTDPAGGCGGGCGAGMFEAAGAGAEGEGGGTAARSDPAAPAVPVAVLTVGRLPL